MDPTIGFCEALGDTEVEALWVRLRQCPGQLRTSEPRNAKVSTLRDYAAVRVDGDQPHGAPPEASRSFVGPEDLQAVDHGTPKIPAVVHERPRRELQAGHVAEHLPTQGTRPE
jgi:hypothetical protein